ncbi:hypothetical protein [Micromonospora maritima]|nr:hypothetical protein [Micromonospora maritima]
MRTLWNPPLSSPLLCGSRGGPQQRQGRGGGAPAPVNDAMAEALRRAGLA